MTIFAASKKPRIRRSSATKRGRAPYDADVRRGPGERIAMIEFESYRRNAAAPTIYVNKVNGVYRLDTALIKVSFGIETPGPGGSMLIDEAVNLLWDPHKWIENGDLFRWVMKEFESGGLRQAIPDDGGGRRPRTQ